MRRIVGDRGGRASRQSDLAKAMTARSKHRGHPMYFDEAADLWRYADDGSAVQDHWKTRPCGCCDVGFTEDGHDPCIAGLPGVSNACCGHGVDSEAYVQFENGRCESGAEAIRVFVGHFGGPMIVSKCARCGEGAGHMNHTGHVRGRRPLHTFVPASDDTPPPTQWERLNDEPFDA